VTPGDGSGSVTGTLESLGGGEYGVYLSHNYSQHGAYTATVVVTGPGSVQTTVTSTVEVGDIYAGESGTLTVAQFALGNPSAPASSYTASINWGDGNSSPGTVTVSGGLLTVTGAHTFTVDSIDASNSAYQVSVTVNGPGGQVLTASKQIEVTRPPVQLQLVPLVEGVDGTVANQVIAAFEVPSTSDTATEFSATIYWGDGSSSSAVVTGANGFFQVFANHGYTSLEQHVIQVVVSQDWGTSIRSICKYETEGPPVLNVPAAALPELQIQGRTAPAFPKVNLVVNGQRTQITTNLFAAGIRWNLTARANGRNGGYIIQHVTSRDLGWDYWELWRVNPSATAPAVRPTTQAQLAQLKREIRALQVKTISDSQAITALGGALTRAQVKTLRTTLAALQGASDLADTVVDDTFAGVINGAPGTAVTISGQAYYIDNIDETNLPTVRGLPVFRVGGVPFAGTLPSAANTAVNMTAIQDFLNANIATRSAVIDQTLTATIGPGGRITVEGRPNPAGLPRLVLPAR
jgi:hypothetical protein